MKIPTADDMKVRWQKVTTSAQYKKLAASVQRLSEKMNDTPVQVEQSQKEILHEVTRRGTLTFSFMGSDNLTCPNIQLVMSDSEPFSMFARVGDDRKLNKLIGFIFTHLATPSLNPEWLDILVKPNWHELNWVELEVSQAFTADEIKARADEDLFL